MKWAYLFLLPVIFASQDPALGQKLSEKNDNMVLTILYNNKSLDTSIVADHGFSCLVEIGDRALLFDAGRIADIFMTNVSNLEVDYAKIRWVFISHIHGDHMGGLFDMLGKCNQPQLYLPVSYPRHRGEPPGDQADRDFKALLARLRPHVSEIIQQKEPVKFGDSFFSTGMIDDASYEQALIIPTSKGLVIITGCAHPGILEIVRYAKELSGQDVFLVTGGFHLMRSDASQIRSIADELRRLTKYIGPCHCTGDLAQDIFKEIFKDDYLDIQAGSRFSLEDVE